MNTLVKSYVIDDNHKILDVIEGSIPEEQANTLQVGESLFLLKLYAKTTNVGGSVSKTEDVPRGEYKIITREELTSEVDTPYIKLTMKKIW